MTGALLFIIGLMLFVAPFTIGVVNPLFSLWVAALGSGVSNPYFLIAWVLLAIGGALMALSLDADLAP